MKLNENDLAKIREAAEFLAPIFQANAWTWGWSETEHTPTPSEIAKRIEDLIWSGEARGANWTGSGRILVNFVRSDSVWDSDEIVISLDIANIYPGQS